MIWQMADAQNINFSTLKGGQFKNVVYGLPL